MKLSIVFMCFFISISTCMQICNHDEIKITKEKFTQPPVIGILSLPLESDDRYQPANWTRISTSYIKYVEAAGAVAVPIYYNHTYEDLKALLHKLNGVLFTGGAVGFFNSDADGGVNFFDPITQSYSDLGRTANYIYQEAIKMNENGIHFPLWGTCMGHQLIMTIESRKMDIIIKSSPRMDLPDSLNFLFTDKSNTRLFQDFSDEFMKALETLPLTYNAHNYALWKSEFYKYDNLVSNYTILSTNIDDNGVEYVSSTEHKKYPFYTVQFHPEVSISKFNEPTVPHSSEAIDLAYLMAEKLVNEAKLNSNSFSNYQEMVSATVEGSGFDEIVMEKLTETTYFKYAFP